jgi:hypothetical protein
LGRKINSEFTLKISDFKYSSISYGSTKLLNFNTFSELFVKDEPIIEDIETKIVTFEKVGMYSMYKFNYETAKKILHLRRLGVGLYASSLDLYCYLIAFMSNKFFYNGIINDIKLNKIWNSIWKTDELEVLKIRLLKNQELDSVRSQTNIDIDLILQTLSNLSLRCDILNYLNELIFKK